ncbi:MAG: DUF86 domain-containing protein [Spirulinaceae cyanobacterium]
MSNPGLLKERLERLLLLRNRIPARFSSIQAPVDFLTTESGLEHLDSICMVLIAVGEEIKKIDRQTNGTLLPGFPQIPWDEIVGMRDFLAHHYFEADPEQIFNTCQQGVPPLIDVVQQMLAGVENGAVS